MYRSEPHYSFSNAAQIDDVIGASPAAVFWHASALEGSRRSDASLQHAGLAAPGIAVRCVCGFLLVLGDPGCFDLETPHRRFANAPDMCMLSPAV